MGNYVTIKGKKAIIFSVVGTPWTTGSPHANSSLNSLTALSIHNLYSKKSHCIRYDKSTLNVKLCASIFLCKICRFGEKVHPRYVNTGESHSQSLTTIASGVHTQGMAV